MPSRKLTSHQALTTQLTGHLFWHALKTPLTNLQLSVDLLRQTSLTSEQTLWLEQAKLNLSRIRELHHEIFTEKTRHTELCFDAVAALQEVISLLKQPADVISGKWPTHVFLPGSKFLFQEMMVCLINNALESYVPYQQRLVFIQASIKNTQLTIRIADGGRGLGSGLKLGEPGHTTKSKGTGLGLSLVKQLARDHWQGKLVVRQRAGRRGTTATLSLGLTPPSDTQNL